jgi:hypothetical protein
MVFKNSLKWSLLLLFALPYTACDDDEPQGFIDQLAGQYTGDYRQLTCTFPQNEVFTVEGSATADVSKISDQEVAVTLGAPSLGTFFQFDGMVDSDTSFTVPPFTAEDQKVYFGNGKLINDEFSVVLSDSCSLLGSQTATVLFREK